MTFIENKPDEIELLSFFESEPVSFEQDNVSFLYVANDKEGCSIDFSFSVIEGWIRYTLKSAGNPLVHNYFEGVGSFNIKNDKSGEYLYTEIITSELITKVEIRVRPFISVNSSTLIR